MNKRNLLYVGFVALVLVLGAGSLRSGLEASGYIVASSFSGEVTCEPGGAADCAVEAT